MIQRVLIELTWIIAAFAAGCAAFMYFLSTMPEPRIRCVVIVEQHFGTSSRPKIRFLQLKGSGTFTNNQFTCNINKETINEQI